MWIFGTLLICFISINRFRRTFECQSRSIILTLCDSSRTLLLENIKLLVAKQSNPLQLVLTWNEHFNTTRSNSYVEHEKSASILLDYLRSERSIQLISRAILTESTCNFLLRHCFESEMVEIVPMIVEAAVKSKVLSFKSLAILIEGYSRIKFAERVTYYFNFRHELNWIKLDSIVYQNEMIFLSNLYLKVLLSMGQQEKAWKHYHSLIEQNQTDFYTFNTLISYLEQHHQLKESYSVWEDTKSYYQQQGNETPLPFGFELTVSSMVRCHLQAGDRESAKRLLMDYPCTLGTFAWLYNLAAKSGNVSLVLREFDDLFDGGRNSHFFGRTKKVRHENRMVSREAMFLEAVVSGLSKATLKPSVQVASMICAVQYFSRLWPRPDLTGTEGGQVQVAGAYSDLLSSTVMSDMTAKTFNILINSLKVMLDRNPPESISWKSIYYSSLQGIAKGQTELGSDSIGVRELCDLLKSALIARMEIQSSDRSKLALCDGYTLSTAVELANALRDSSFAEYIWSNRMLVHNPNPASEEYFCNAYLRSFRSPQQLALLQKFAHEQFGMRWTAFSAADPPPQRDPGQGSEAQGLPRGAHRGRFSRRLVSLRTGDEFVNALLRVCGPSVAVGQAISLLSDDREGDREGDDRYSNSPRLRWPTASPLRADKLPLESSISNIVISFDRFWRDASNSNSDSDSHETNEYDEDHSTSIQREAEQLTTLLIASKRFLVRHSGHSDGNRDEDTAGEEGQTALTREMLLWASVIAALLSRGLWSESWALVRKLEAARGQGLPRPTPIPPRHPSATASVSASARDGLVTAPRRLCEVQQVVKVMELAVMSALDGSLPLLTASALPALAEMEAAKPQSVGPSRLLELKVPRSQRLPYGDLRTVVSVPHILQFLLLAESEAASVPGKSRLSAPYRGPIGVSLLEFLFYGCVDKRNFASAAKIVGLLEHCRLVIDVRQSMRVLQTAAAAAATATATSAGEDYVEVNPADDKSVREYLARKWTAMLLARSIKTFQSAILNKSIQLINNRKIVY